MPPASWTPPRQPSCGQHLAADARNARALSPKPKPPFRSFRCNWNLANRHALKQSILNRVRAEATPRKSAPMRIGGWDRIVLPAAVAAVLAVAVTLLVVKQFWPVNVRSPEDQRTIADLQVQLRAVEAQLVEGPQSLKGMKFAQLTGSAQPAAVGHVFLDTSMKNWYFFTCGMKPARTEKPTNCGSFTMAKNSPAGTFDVNRNGTATLLGSIPPLPGGATVTLAVTDEPANGPNQVPRDTCKSKVISNNRDFRPSNSRCFA